MTRVRKSDAQHIVGKLSGVKETDSKATAALKAIATMKAAGLSTREAVRMLADYRARTGE